MGPVAASRHLHSRVQTAYCAAYRPAVSCSTMNVRIVQSLIPLFKAHPLA